MIAVTFYTKPDCDLCQHAREALDLLAAEFPHRLTEMSILDEPALFERYKDSIPVVIIGDLRLAYPFSELDLRAALKIASELTATHESL